MTNQNIPGPDVVRAEIIYAAKTSYPPWERSRSCAAQRTLRSPATRLKPVSADLSAGGAQGTTPDKSLCGSQFPSNSSPFIHEGNRTTFLFLICHLWPNQRITPLSHLSSLTEPTHHSSSLPVWRKLFREDCQENTTGAGTMHW